MMTSVLSLVWLLCSSPTPTSAPADPAAMARVRAIERARVEIVQRLTPCVVCIFPRGSRAGGGSGVIIDSHGYGLTNFHVIRGMIGERRGEAGLPDGKIYPLEVLGFDPGGDVAMFKIDRDKPFYPAPLGDSDGLRVGDWTLAMGNPFLLAEDFQPTVTCGIVSGLHRYQRGEGRALNYTDCIQVDTSINPGNSGGPLFDLRGDLVGINGRISIEERGRVNVGLGYAITINQIRRFIPALRAGLVTKHATLGATTRDKALRNVVVDQILSDSCAAKAGLKLGDRVLRFGGVDVQSANHLLTLLGTYPAEWPVTMTIEREGKRQDLNLRLDAIPLPRGLRPLKNVAEQTQVKNPLRPNPEANARAVMRAWDRYQRFVGRAEAVSRVNEVRVAGERRRAGKAEDASTALDVVEKRPGADAKPPEEPGELEQWIRWSLLSPLEDAWKAGYRVVGGDEIGGEIVVVIERKAEGLPEYRLYLEDDGGALRAIEFDAKDDGRRVRYEYDDYRRVGAIRWPFKRRVLIGGEPLFSDELSKVEPAAGGA